MGVLGPNQPPIRPKSYERPKFTQSLKLRFEKKTVHIVKRAVAGWLIGIVDEYLSPDDVAIAHKYMTITAPMLEFGMNPFTRDIHEIMNTPGSSSKFAKVPLTVLCNNDRQLSHLMLTEAKWEIAGYF